MDGLRYFCRKWEGGIQWEVVGNYEQLDMKFRNNDLVLWAVVGAVGRMALMIVFVILALFVSIMSFDSGMSIRNLANAIGTNLIMEALYLRIPDEVRSVIPVISVHSVDGLLAQS